MKSVVLSLVLTIFAVSVQAQGGGFDNWKELRVTYNTNKDAKGAFEKMPSTCTDAKKAGWRKIGGNDAKCNVGYKYILNNDPAVVLIYAENSYLVGFETGFPESQMKSDELKAWYKQQPMFQVVHPDYNKDETLYTLKVYFTDPDKVCDKNMNYVPNFYYYNGTQKALAPHDASQFTDKSWAHGKCLPGKGDHYYYAFTKDMNCDNFQPFFLMYHKTKLVAFSFVAFGEFDSPRYGTDEYHPSTQYSALVDVVPECLYKVPYNLTTLHGYMIESPWDIDCKN